jgi:hypothetical protein
MISRKTRRIKSNATNLLTPWKKGVVLEKLTGSQLDKKSPDFMKPEGSLPHSQVPATPPPVPVLS